MGVISDKLFNTNFKNFLNKAENPLKDKKQLSYTHLVRGDALRMRNYFWESIEEYITALQYDDNCFDTYIGLGLSYKQIGYTKSAITAFSKARKINSFDKYTYYETGCCLCMDKNYQKATEYFIKAIKISPDFIEARLNLALAYELSFKNNCAINEYKTIIERFPDHFLSYNNLGSLYMKLDLYYPAIEIFKKLLRVDRGYSRAYLGIGIAMDKLGYKKKALRFYKKYLKLKPDSTNLPYILERIQELKNDTFSRKRNFVVLK
jgi:tetratricopeptide (TPR) repeat protein